MTEPIQHSTAELEDLLERGAALATHRELVQLVEYLKTDRHAVTLAAGRSEQQAEETAAELRRQVRSLADAHADGQQRLHRFKGLVREVAARYAHEHDWCAVIDEALGELGLEPIDREFTIRVRFEGLTTLKVTANNEESAVANAIERSKLSNDSTYTLGGGLEVTVRDIDGEVWD